MSPKAIEIQSLLSHLDDKDVDDVLSYTKRLADIRKKEKAVQAMLAMDQFHSLLEGEKTWDSEEEMLKELAEFRRKRMAS